MMTTTPNATPRFTVRKVNTPCVRTRYAIYDGRRKAGWYTKGLREAVDTLTFRTGTIEQDFKVSEQYYSPTDLFDMREAAEAVAAVLNNQ